MAGRYGCSYAQLLSLRYFLGVDATHHIADQNTFHPSVLTFQPIMQVSVLFLFFLLISVCFDTLIGFLHWCNYKLGGPKPLWVEKLQEELLDLGVISLVLVFVEVRVILQNDMSCMATVAGHLTTKVR